MFKRRSCPLGKALLVVALAGWMLWLAIHIPKPPTTEPPPPYYPLRASEEPPYHLEELPGDDYTRLINITDFRFTKMSLCNDGQPLLLVLVHSAPENKIKRASIRATWGAARESMCLRFFMGATKPRIEWRLQKEQGRHGDLVQGNFLDTYRNLTYKHVMLLKYAAYHCPRARYILKTDDDVFVNMYAMMTYLKDMSVWGARRLIFCDVLRGRFSIRSYRTKWRVTVKEWPARYYPNFCAGWVILYSPDVVFKLYREAQRSEYFWIDDVIVTGTLVERAHLAHKQFPSELLLKYEDIPKLWMTNRTADQFRFLTMVPWYLYPNKIRELWAAVDSYYKRQDVPEADYHNYVLD